MLKQKYDKFEQEYYFEFSVNGQALGSFCYSVNHHQDVYIFNLHIDSDSNKGKGYGTQMVKELVKFFKKRYPKLPITLETRLYNFPAIGAYLKNNFIPHYIRDNDAYMVYNDSTLSTFELINEGKKEMKDQPIKDRYLCKLLSTNKNLHYIFNKLRLNLDKKLWEHWDNERA